MSTDINVNFTRAKAYHVSVEQHSGGITTIENDVIINRTLEQTKLLYEHLGLILGVSE